MKYRWLSLTILLSHLLFAQNLRSEPVTVKASYGSLGLTQAILPIGKEAGMFKESGLNVEPVYIAGRAVLALVGGDVQFSMMGGPPAILGRLGGADLVILGGANTLNQILVSSPSIKDPKDLIGKRGGISRFGTTADYSMRIALKKLGLVADRDVTLVQIGDSAARVGGLKTQGLLKKDYREPDDALAAEQYKALVGIYPGIPYVTEDAVKVVLDILRDKGELKKRVEPSEFLNMSFLQKAAETEKTR